MSLEVKQPRTRRALLAGLGGGIAALAAGALRGLPTMRAADGGNFILGQSNSASSITSLSNTTPMDAPTLEVTANWTSGITSARAIQGDGAGADGVWGMSSGGLGVVGSGQTGIRGMAPTFGIGQAAAGLGSGVAGFNVGSVPAVLGQSLGDSTGVQGFSGGSNDMPPAAVNDTGVYGVAVADAGTGVHGRGASTPTSSSLGVLGEGYTGVLGAGTFGVLGSAAATGIGVYGSVSDAPGVPAVFGKSGVIGQSDAGGTAVVGFTGLTAPVPAPDTGIYGRSNTGGTNGRGLVGFCAAGIGLLGQTISGVGVRAYCANNTGLALRVTGKAAFDRSGKTTITAGHSSVAKTGIALTSASFILATLQTNVAGLFIQAVVTNPAGSSFTIYLNKAPTKNVAVAWLAVN